MIWNVVKLQRTSRILFIKLRTINNRLFVIASRYMVVAENSFNMVVAENSFKTKANTWRDRGKTFSFLLILDEKYRRLSPGLYSRDDATWRSYGVRNITKYWNSRRDLRCSIEIYSLWMHVKARKEVTASVTSFENSGRLTGCLLIGRSTEMILASGCCQKKSLWGLCGTVKSIVKCFGMKSSANITSDVKK